MTRTKLEFATILATLRGANEDPQKLAQEMTLRKLCYEIEKAEDVVVPSPESVEVEEKIKSLWGMISLDDSE